MASVFDLLQSGFQAQPGSPDPWRELEEIIAKNKALGQDNQAGLEAAARGPLSPWATTTNAADAPSNEDVGRSLSNFTMPPDVLPAPAATRPAPAAAPGGGENPVMQFLRGFTKNNAGLLPDIVGGLDQGPRENQTVKLLMSKMGVDEQQARTIARNPDMMKQVIGTMFNKGYTLKGDERRFNDQNQEIAAGGPKFVNVAEGGGVFDTGSRSMVAQTGPKDTPHEKDYLKYEAEEKAAGRKPLSRFEREAELKKLGAIAVTFGGEQGFSKTTGELQAKDFHELVQRGRNAKTVTADLAALRDIGSRITTGKTAEIIGALGPYADALGIKIDGLDDIQAYKAITSRLAPRMRVPGSGATSDFEMRTFLDSLPNIGRLPNGNAIVDNVFQALQDNDVRMADIASRAIAGDITRAQAEKELRDLPNPFEAWKKSRGTAPSTPPGGRDRVWTQGTGVR